MKMVLALKLLLATGALVAGSLKVEASAIPFPQDAEKQEAQRLWELAIEAKGGRDRLYQVASFANSDESGKVVDFLVFPDKYLEWADTRPSKLGLIVEMLNFEQNFGYIIFGDNPPDARRKEPLNPVARSKFIYAHLYYFLETRWFKPELLKSYKGKVNGKRVDLIEIKVSGYGEPYRHKVFLDEVSHLPVRIGVMSNLRNEDMFDWVDLGDYKEVAGIKVPTAIGGQGGWNRILIEINPDYNPQVFEREPDTKAGPFQWRKVGRNPIITHTAVEGLRQRLTQEDMTRYIKDLQSNDSERVLNAGRELIRAGEQAIPALTNALKDGSPDLRFFAAAALLAINPENEAGVQGMKNLLLDSGHMPDTRQEAAFRLAAGKKGRAELIELMRHPDRKVRRCVIFAFDELTEMTEIPEQVMQAVPALKQLLKDKDKVVRGMAEEVLEQIQSYQKNRKNHKNRL